MRSHSIRRASAIGLAVLVGVLSGCGGSDEGDVAATEETPEAIETQAPAAEAQPVEVTAVEGSEGLGWDPEELSAAAGAVTIAMENPDGNSMPHTVAIEGNGVDVSGEAVEGGQTSEVSADLEPGEYTFYCPVGQHRENGMEGTLTIE